MAARPLRAWVALICAVSALAAMLWTFDSSVIRWVSGWTGVAYPTLATAWLLAILVVLCFAWPTPVLPDEEASTARVWASAATLAALLILALTVSRWMNRIVLLGFNGDMLVQITEAVKRFASGLNPYHVYYVPWELPLSYGPTLWMWYLVPYALQADFRLVTIFGELFAAALLAVAAVVDAYRRRYLDAAALGVLAVVAANNPAFDRFLLGGHTPAYWPLIALFALLASSERSRSAAVALGLLLVARTTMIALAPTFFIYLWRNDRHAILPAAALMGVVVVLLLGPFAVLDWRVMMYGMYGNYVRIITGYVWHQTNWMDSTIGLTRLLLEWGLSTYVAIVQALILLVTYAVTWCRLRPGTSAAPWYCLALTIFCMTTLWPVYYAFLDAFVLGLCFYAAAMVPELRQAPWRTMAAATTVTMTVILGTLVVNPGVYYTVEPGRTPRWYLRSGFGPDERDGDRNFAWATRDLVYLRLPRGIPLPASIQIDCEPFVPDGAPAQSIGLTLNGKYVGQAQLAPGWQTVTFNAPRRAWRVGHNDARLYFKYAAPAANGERRAARIGRITIGP
jgi:hypothetical protein